ncbi:MAG TPA: DeoR/GlpR family DNA-binding transcription regulator [Sphingomonadaceae bacterium]|nr:DeoR/GlpR family DNA-binding transcription regulator [Sphingomonadaceae bacterium]
MHKVERHRHILARLGDEPFLSVVTLAKELSTSPVTIRRDLTELASSGRLNRVHGGAETDPTGRGTLQGETFKRNLTRNVAPKRAIAKAAAAMCRRGDSIIVDGGTTTFQMSRYLKGLDLQVLTNSLHIVRSLIDDPAIRLVVPAGQVFREQNIILSPFEEDGLTDYVASTMFMGAEAVTASGIQQSDPLLVHAEHRFLRHAKKLIIMADSSKFEAGGSLLFCPLSEVDVIISDRALPEARRDMILEAGVELVIA